MYDVSIGWKCRTISALVIETGCPTGGRSHDWARDAAGVPAALVPALFLACWMHRAPKEAIRLPAAKVETGHCVGLLRLCLDRAADAGLRRVLGVVGDAGRAAS